METRHPQEYDPSRYYLPLMRIAAPPHEILEILFQQASTALPDETLLRKEEVKDELLLICNFLQRKFREILEQENLWEAIRDNLSWKEGDQRIPSVEEICRFITKEKQKEKIRFRLSRIRDSLSPDCLAALGFLPPEIFSRSEYELHRTGGEQNGLDYALLHETFPAWVRPEWIENPNAFLEASNTMDSEKRRSFPELFRRILWMKETERDFQRCIREAFNYLKELRKKMIPGNALPQPYSLHADLGTKSFVELLEIILDPSELSERLKRRFDALQILEMAIKFFDVMRNPIYQAQFEVRREIHERLNIGVWSEGMGSRRVPVMKGRGGYRPQFESDAGNTPASFTIAREVRDEIRAVLNRFQDIVAIDDKLWFDSRPKTHISYVQKETLMQELARKCETILSGGTVDDIPDRQYARRKMRELETRTRRRHPQELFPYKPASLQIIDDGVGLTFAVALKEPMKKIERSKKKQNRVEACLAELRKIITRTLGLKNVKRTENNLWGRGRRRNLKRDTRFRDYKFHGVIPYRFDEDTANVPVEVQLQPLEVHLAALSPGHEASADAYSQRKARDLAKRVLPSRIGDAPFFPRTDTGELAQTL